MFPLLGPRGAPRRQNCTFAYFQHFGSPGTLLDKKVTIGSKSVPGHQKVHFRDTRRECCSSTRFLDGSGGPGTQKDYFGCKSALFAQKCHLGRKSAPWGPKSPLATKSALFAPSWPLRRHAPSKPSIIHWISLPFQHGPPKGRFWTQKRLLVPEASRRAPEPKRCSQGSRERCPASFATFCEKVRLGAQGR